MTPARRQAAELYDRAFVGNDDAEQKYRLLSSAVCIDPDFAQGWLTLGHKLGNDMGLLEASVAAYLRSLECPITGQPGDRTPQMASQAWCNISLRLHHMGASGAEDAARKGIEADPGMAFGWTNLSMICSRQGRHEEAIRYARKAFEMAPDKPEAELGLAFALLFVRQWAEGLARFESRFPYRLKSYAGWPYPKWKGQRVGTLIVVSEQGLGDCISFARFVPQAAERCDKLIFAIQPELVGLLQRSLPMVDVVPWPKVYPLADAWISIVSLTTALGLTDQEIEDEPGLLVPRLTAPTGSVSSGDRFRVGICWGGASGNDIDKFRSLPGPEPFLALYRVPGVELYSFQIGDRAPQLHTCGAVSLIRDLTPWIRDVSDAAAILSQMDLVITVETFLGHLAGFLGLPCWILYSWSGQDYRIGDGDRGALWYPKHRIFRQGPEADWRPVWDRVVAALDETVKEHSNERDNRAEAD